MIEQGDDSSLSCRSYLLGMVCPFSVCPALVVAIFSRAPGNDLYGNLHSGINQLSGNLFGIVKHGQQREILTCSPPSILLASFTFPMLPAPIVLPRTQLPVCAGMVVLDLEGRLAPACLASEVVVGVTIGAGPPPFATAVVADMLDGGLCLLREDVREW